jgi:hypothetical protein
MQRQQQQQQQSGPPYAPTTAALGGQPTVIPDIPITAVFLCLFICSAATHMAIFQLNRKHDHKFLFSALLFGFSMARIAALVMRIVWATRTTNISIAIASSILVQAGVVILFITNIYFTERILLAYHPRLRDSRVVRLTLGGLVALVVLLIIMTIIVTVHSIYTLDLDARQRDREVQLFSGTFLALLAFLPIPVVSATVLSPRSRKIEKFGTGRLRTKVRLLLFTSALLTLGAGWRLGTNYAAAPLNNPGWYNHKAAFYTVNFVVELIVSFTYAISRFDQRFHVPNKAKKGEQKQDGTEANKVNEGPNFTRKINTEAETFGAGEDATDEPKEDVPTLASRQSDVEMANKA